MHLYTLWFFFLLEQGRLGDHRITNLFPWHPFLSFVDATKELDSAVFSRTVVPHMPERPKEGKAFMDALAHQQQAVREKGKWYLLSLETKPLGLHEAVTCRKHCGIPAGLPGTSLETMCQMVIPYIHVCVCVDYFSSMFWIPCFQNSATFTS